MANPGPDEAFVRNLTGCQNRLYAYVLSLVPDMEAAREVVQNANVEIWKNAGNFTPGTNFGAWACKMAYFAVLAHRRDRGRERLVFDDDVVESLATTAGAREDKTGPQSVALEECLKHLSPQQHDLIKRRYGEGQSLASLAQGLGRSAGNLATRLFRIRQALLDCIRGKLAAENVP